MWGFSQYTLELLIVLGPSMHSLSVETSTNHIHRHETAINRQNPSHVRHSSEPGNLWTVKTEDGNTVTADDIDCIIPSMMSTPGLILGLRPANERWRYIVTTSLIGWVQT